MSYSCLLANRQFVYNSSLKTLPLKYNSGFVEKLAVLLTKSFLCIFGHKLEVLTPQSLCLRCLKEITWEFKFGFFFRFVDAVDELISSWLGVRLFAFQMVAIGEVFQFVVVSVKLQDISSVHEH